MVTFLAAGHETTSGTLSFLFYNLLKYPETLQKAQQEVDQVLGVCFFLKVHGYYLSFSPSMDSCFGERDIHCCAMYPMLWQS